MAEKKYVIDNAKLMAEWDWKKNNELGFPVPVVDEQCDDCGECLKYCDYGNND